MIPFDPAGSQNGGTLRGEFTIDQLQAITRALQTFISTHGPVYVSVDYFNDYQQDWVSVTGQLRNDPAYPNQVAWRTLDSIGRPNGRELQWPASGYRYANLSAQEPSLISHTLRLLTELTSVAHAANVTLSGVHHLGLSVQHIAGQAASTLTGIESIGAGIQHLGHTTQTGLEAIGSSVQASAIGLQALGNAAEAAQTSFANSAKELLQSIANETRTLSGLRSRQQDEQATIQLQKQELDLLKREFEIHQAAEQQRLSQMEQDTADHREQLRIAKTRNDAEEARLKLAEKTLADKVVHLERLSDEITRHDSELRAQRLRAITLQRDTGTQVRPQQHYVGNQTGPSLSQVSDSHNGHPRPQQPSAQTDPQLQALQAEIAQLRSQLTKRQGRRSASSTSSSSSSDDDMCPATDEDDEESAKKANARWTRVERQQTSEERTAGSYSAGAFTNVQFIQEWRRRLQPTATTPEYYRPAIDRMIESLAIHHRLLLLPFASNRSLYAAAKAMRVTLESAAILQLQINGITGEGITAFTESLSTARAKNRKGKAIFVGIDSLVRRLINGKKYRRQTKGGAFSRQKGPKTGQSGGRPPTSVDSESETGSTHSFRARKKNSQF